MTSPYLITTALAWCLAWGNQRQPQFDLTVLQQMRQALNDGTQVPEGVRSLVKQVERLQKIDDDYFPKTLKSLQNDYPDLWEQKTPIGLVYGGATKIKQYVFEAAKLPDIRGASALLDRINLVDLPAFFGKGQNFNSISQWLRKNFPELEAALKPELIIYSRGGNILAFCPAAFVDDLANAIERRYTEETLTANSCAVGAKFKLLELRFGLLQSQIEDTPWLNWYLHNQQIPLLKAYFEQSDVAPQKAFENRKRFSELTGQLVAQFNQRRNGNDLPGVSRPSRRYPPMFETHPYLRRDEGDRRSAVMKAEGLPGEPYFSEPLARKRILGQIAKQEVSQEDLPAWFKNMEFDWQPVGIKSWVTKFEEYLKNNHLTARYYTREQKTEEARTLREIGNAYKGFVAYIYADGNNMGGYIQKVKTPQEYKQFSEDIFNATEKSVYEALAKHLKPHKLNNLTDPDNENRNGHWIHPFEILTIGGDDVMLIVPANRALEIAKTIGEEFEHQLSQTGRYPSVMERPTISPHRYQGQQPSSSQCPLSMSTGLLITAEDTPIYYAQKLTEQLLKSAKKRAKELNKIGYYGGTVDFLTLKSVTMISSSIEDFRKQGLTKSSRGQTLKLYAAPYTLYELGGLIDAVKALKKSGFPRSQLYQIRSLLEQGKQTAILNYRYFRVRLESQEQKGRLKTHFEEAWCKAKTNRGNLAPWMFDPQETAYETIWRELVDLYDFIETSATETTDRQLIKREAGS